MNMKVKVILTFTNAIFSNGFILLTNVDKDILYQMYCTLLVHNNDLNRIVK